MTAHPLALVLVRRRSPEWSALSDDLRAGRPIDPVRWLPPADAIGFPRSLPQLVEAWNEWFALD